MLPPYAVHIPLFVVAIITVTCDAQFVVHAGKDGSYKMSVNGDTWLSSAPTYVHANGQKYSTDDGSLKYSTAPSTGKGMDTFGNLNIFNYTYVLSKDEQKFDATIKVYKDVPAAVFSQHFRQTLMKTSVGDPGKVTSSFPSFTIPDTGDLGYLHYGGLFIGWIGMQIGKFQSKFIKMSNGLDSGPLVLFDKNDNVVIISPFSEFMAASFYHNNMSQSLDWGIMGEVNDIPDGYHYETIVFYSDDGITEAMREWGNLMRKWYRRDESARNSDPNVRYLGFYTDNEQPCPISNPSFVTCSAGRLTHGFYRQTTSPDNTIVAYIMDDDQKRKHSKDPSDLAPKGAYYYHKTEPKMNYENTMLAAVLYAQKLDIPYRYLQYDDWFYPILGPGYGATITWDALHSVFPHGLNWLYNKTKLPVVAHNRYWSYKTTYAKQNGGKFNFLMDKKLSLPDDQDFWDFLFATAKEWGLQVYEQDWLNYQVEQFEPLHQDLTLGSRWLQQMGNAASRYGMQIQYCMALPRHLLAALTVPAVSHVRASIDYHLRAGQWRIGITSMFADAVGLAPFKDNFWSTKVQPGNPYNQTEANPLLQAVVSLLSTGPVGPSDRVGYSDAGLIHRLSMVDGTLLKPSHPAVAIHEQILQTAFGGAIGPEGEVWTTYSDISSFAFGIIFAADLKVPYQLRPKQAFRKQFQPSYVWSYKLKPSTEAPQIFSEEQPLKLGTCPYEDFCLHYTAPVMQWGNTKVLLLGELSKIVPMSPQRVVSISSGDNDVLVTLRGSPGESFQFYVAIVSQEVFFIPCKIGGNGQALLSVADRSCL